MAVALKGHWKLSQEQYLFCLRLLNLHRLHTGHKFDKRLRGWLFFNQQTRLHAADFLAFESLFDICGETRDRDCGALYCGTPKCQDYNVCLSVYEIISNQSDYSPIKVGDSEGSYSPEPPILHGKVAELLRFWDSFRL
jgi:hypothetical protein